MVGEWTRQAARATGISLFAPVVLLVAAGLVASGGGVTGLGALGQLAGGPALPDTGTDVGAEPGRNSLADAEIFGADTSEPSAGPAAVETGGGLVARAPGRSDRGGSDRGGVEVDPLPPAAPAPAPAPGAPAPGAPAQGGGGQSPPPPSAVDQVIEETRDVGESLPGPLGPTTGDILDLLLPPGSP